MTYEINGSNGIYDGKVNDSSVRYGRNSVANHKALITSTINSGLEGEAPILDFMPTESAIDNNINKMEKFADHHDEIISNLPPVNYQYRYMTQPKNGEIDKKALFGAAYEEMGSEKIPVSKFEKMFLPSNEYTAKPLDINNDGDIDISEYSASMLASDMLSKDNPEIANIDGSMNSKGMNAVMEYSKKSRADAAVKLYSQLYSAYKLNELG